VGTGTTARGRLNTGGVPGETTGLLAAGTFVGFSRAAGADVGGPIPAPIAEAAVFLAKISSRWSSRSVSNRPLDGNTRYPDCAELPSAYHGGSEGLRHSVILPGASLLRVYIDESEDY
jgi:hypothetical protein